MTENKEKLNQNIALIDWKWGEIRSKHCIEWLKTRRNYNQNIALNDWNEKDYEHNIALIGWKLEEIILIDSAIISVKRTKDCVDWLKVILVNYQ